MDGFTHTIVKEDLRNPSAVSKTVMACQMSKTNGWSFPLVFVFVNVSGWSAVFSKTKGKYWLSYLALDPPASPTSFPGARKQPSRTKAD